MQNYVFMTDSDSDLPLELKQQYDIPVVYMPYSLDGKEYFDDLGQSLNHKSFYDKMRAGSQPTTSASTSSRFSLPGATCSSSPFPASSARPFRRFTPRARNC